jgi:hypothetical protein
VERPSFDSPDAHGKILRLIVAAEATIVWSADNWASTNKMETTPVSALNVWFADLPTEKCPDGSVIEFTFLLERSPALGSAHG